MPLIPQSFKESLNKTIIDKCFEPLTTRQGCLQRDSTINHSRGNLVEGSLAQRLEALIGIHDILEKYPALLPHTPKTTLLMKTIMILKERQFPQHVFEAIRLINLLIDNQTNVAQLIQAGGYVILMDVMTLQSRNILMLSALWTCCKMKFYENNHYGYYSEREGELGNMVNKAINKYNKSGEESIDEFIQMCSRFDEYHTYVMPKHFGLLTAVIIEQIIKVKIRNQTIVQKAMQFISRNTQDNQISQLIENKECKEYEQLLHNLSGLPPEIIVHYAQFICQSIQRRESPKLTYFFYSQQTAIIIFQPLFYTQYNFEKETFINFLISIFKCQKKVVINYFKKRPEMVMKVLELIVAKVSDKKRDSGETCKSRRTGVKFSADSSVNCRALQFSYYLLCSDFVFYWPLYKKYQFLENTLEIVKIESKWSIAYEVFANQLYMLKNYDEVEFDLQLEKLDKSGLRSIVEKLQNRPEIEMELKFLREYLESFNNDC